MRILEKKVPPPVETVFVVELTDEELAAIRVTLGAAQTNSSRFGKTVLNLRTKIGGSVVDPSFLYSGSLRLLSEESDAEFQRVVRSISTSVVVN